MDKNAVIGFILMGLVLFGFTFYQNRQYKKQVAYQAQLDSINRAEHPEWYVEDVAPEADAAQAYA